MKKVPDNCLAEGENSGHQHVAEGATAVVENEDGTRSFSVPKTGAMITHQEHKHIPESVGDYCSGRVREQDHFAEEARQVMD